jgi:leader peptidase (prepilin peptidase)/N-methyltransferase
MLITPSKIALVICLTMLATGLMLWQFNIAWPGFATGIFILMLVILAIIDLHIQLLPDKLTQPLIWGGLLANLNGTFVPLQDAVLGAVFGYLALWLLARAYLFCCQQQGIGHGDFKLAAALGAWLGYKILFTETLILALLGGGSAGLLMLLIFFHKKRYRLSEQRQSFTRLLQTPIPFGPFLAAAGIWSILFSVN